MSRPPRKGASVAVVIPCYKVKTHILSVIAAIGPEVSAIFVVDDKCPDASGDFVRSNCTDRRVTVIENDENLGVGGAVMRGYAAAIANGSEIIVKIDGDGQMDPALLPIFTAPIMSGDADYTKGNRFFDPEAFARMPKARIAGNATLSFMTKLSSGYWNIFDPTNGYTAIHARVAEHLPFHKISNRYFFETDMLFRLNSFGAVVVDVPMTALYADEVSGLKIEKILPEFLAKHCRNFCKRIIYRYFTRDFTAASLELLAGLLLFGFGCVWGVYHWYQSSASGIAATAGTVMIAALTFLMGVQLLLAFLNYDIASVPKRVLHTSLTRWKEYRNVFDEADQSAPELPEGRQPL